jgi:hypothetical protein
MCKERERVTSAPLHLLPHLEHRGFLPSSHLSEKVNDDGGTGGERLPQDEGRKDHRHDLTEKDVDFHLVHGSKLCMDLGRRGDEEKVEVFRKAAPSFQLLRAQIDLSHLG